MESTPLLEVIGLTKTYGMERALDNVSFSLNRGEVRALVGENGAGKSTLVKAICGAIQYDYGKMLFEGEALVIKRPHDAFDAGIATMYQEFNLLPTLSVAENLFIGREKVNAAGFLQKQRMNKQAKALLEQIGLELDPETRVSILSTAQKQMLEILKGIVFNAKLIFMDEPSAVLTETEVQNLFKIIRRLADSGVTVVYISHRMEEIFKIADSVTVLKDGKHIITAPLSHFADEQAVVRYMIGREMDESYFSSGIAHSVDRGEEVLRAEHFKSEKINDVSFSLYKGEVLGFAGLVGSGRTEIIRAVFGADRLQSGYIAIYGEKKTINSPKDAIRCHIGFVPEDRAMQGIILAHSIKNNISLAIIDKLLKRGFLDAKKQRSVVKGYIAKLGVKLSSINAPAKSLSGGNQQKAILAKWMASESKILILDEPTRGIDVGAKAEIYRILAEISSAGISIIIVSSELKEILNICDRILVVSNHRIVREMLKEDATEEKIMTAAIIGHETGSKESA